MADTDKNQIQAEPVASPQSEKAIVKVVPTPYELTNLRQIEELEIEMAMRDIWPGAPRAEAEKAIHIAKARGANPWCGDIFLVKYKTKYGDRWSVIVGQNYVIKVATGHPACAGWQDGVIVQSADGKIEQLEGDFVPKSWTLVGAWFRGYRHGWKVPITKRVNLEAYDKNTPGPWTTIKATMITKVPRTQGLRQMLPDRLSGMYDAAEMDQMGQPIETLGPSSAATELPPALPSTTEEKQRGRPRKASPTTDKDSDHISELSKIIAVMVGVSPVIVVDAVKKQDISIIAKAITEEQAAAAQDLLKFWSRFEGTVNGQPQIIHLKSLKDPRLKGKWLNKILSNAREHWGKWLIDNPETAQTLEQFASQDKDKENEQEPSD